MHQEKVDRIVSVITNASPNGTQMHQFGQLQVVDDAYAWRLGVRLRLDAEESFSRRRPFHLKH